MRVLLDYYGIDNSHVFGGLNIRSNSAKMFTITFQCLGSYFGGMIFLENIHGTANLAFQFPSNMEQTGLIYFNDIQCNLELRGNKTNLTTNDGCLLKRTGSSLMINDGIMCKNCSYVDIQAFRIASNSNESYSGISFYNTTGYIAYNDIYNFRQSIWLNYASVCHSYCNIGTNRQYGINCITSKVVVEGDYPRATENGDEKDWNVYTSWAGDSEWVGSYQGTWSIQAAPPVTSKVVTSSFSPSGYQSTRGYSENIFYQSSWGSSYGDWVGYVYFGADVRDFLNGATGINMQIYVQRKSSSHGMSSGAKVRISGTEVGTLDLGQGAWFVVPQNVVNGLMDGSINYIMFDGKGTDHYIQFEQNATLWIQCTKTI